VYIPTCIYLCYKLKVLNKYISYPKELKIFSEREISFVRSTRVTDKAQEK
jgi:hypothetical protein